MARYFLHLHECGTILDDPEGQECASLEEATRVATINARDVMIGDMRTGRLCLGCYISITDGSAVELGRVYFRDAVVVTGWGDLGAEPA